MNVVSEVIVSFLFMFLFWVIEYEGMELIFWVGFYWVVFLLDVVVYLVIYVDMGIIYQHGFRWFMVGGLKLDSEKLEKKSNKSWVVKE